MTHTQADSQGFVTFAELAACELGDEDESVDADELVSEVAGDDSGDDSAALDVSGAADVACDWAAVGLDDMGLLGTAAPDDELPPLSTVLHPASVSEASASVGTMVRLIFMASSWLSVSSF